jgi:TonB family protein
VTTHVISATYTRFDRMSPTAAALAVLLHVATALALWWVSQLGHRTVELTHPAIEVTLEPPAPEPVPEPRPEPEIKPLTPPSMAKPPAPKAPAAQLGLPPPSPTITEKPQQAAKPDPKPEGKSQPKPEPQQALAPPAAAPPPETLENVLPPLQAPPPPVTSKEMPKPPPRPAPPRPKPPASPPQQHQQLSPSPLSALQQHRAPSNPQATAPSATFVNPADRYNQNSIVEQYLWGVARKISQYRYHSSQANEQGTVVLRLVIRRDGHLLDVSVARSSGIVNLDRGLVEAARAAAPYAALPASLPGPQITFTLPFASVYRPQ